MGPEPINRKKRSFDLKRENSIFLKEKRDNHGDKQHCKQDPIYVFPEMKL